MKGAGWIYCFGLAAALASAQAQATVCPSGGTQPGVDASRFDGAVDWGQVRAAGSVFAFARVDDGPLAGAWFDTNYAEIKSVGMLRGAYQVYQPTVPVAAQTDRLLAKIGLLGPGDLPPTLVVESSSGQSPAAIANGVQTWVSIMQQATGRVPIISTYAAFWNTKVGSSSFSANPLWVEGGLGACPALPAAWLNWAFWQPSRPPGQVAGISHDVFNGSMARLNRLAGNVIDVQLEIERGEGRQPPAINLHGHRRLRVEIRSSATFDATEIDVGTLTFGHTGGEQSLASCHPEESDDEPWVDLVCRFHTERCGFQPGDTEALLEGETVAGLPIQGRATIRIVERNGSDR